MALIGGLLALDRVDTQIKAAQDEIAAGPAAIAEAEAAEQAADKHLTAVSQQSTDDSKRIHELEVDIDSLNEETNKTRGHQRQAKSNKEYQIFSEKIETDEKKVRDIEDRILALMEQQEAAAAAAENAADAVARARSALQETRLAVETRSKELEAALQQLQVTRDEAASGIDPDDLNVYERARRGARGASAMAPLRGTACGACHVTLPAQTVNLAIIGKDIVSCISCHRILYVDEHTDTRSGEDAG